MVMYSSSTFWIHVGRSARYDFNLNLDATMVRKGNLLRTDIAPPQLLRETSCICHLWVRCQFPHVYTPIDDLTLYGIRLANTICKD